MGKVLDEVGLAELWSLVKAEDGKAPKLVIGSYSGTGTYGSNNPTTFTVGFVPEMLILAGEGSNMAVEGVNVPRVFIKPVSNIKAAQGAGDYNCYCRWYDNKVELYSNTGAGYQYNATSKYFYAILGWEVS